MSCPRWYFFFFCLQLLRTFETHKRKTQRKGEKDPRNMKEGAQDSSELINWEVISSWKWLEEELALFLGLRHTTGLSGTSEPRISGMVRTISSSLSLWEVVWDVPASFALRSADPYASPSFPHQPSANCPWFETWSRVLPWTNLGFVLGRNIDGPRGRVRWRSRKYRSRKFIVVLLEKASSRG